MAVQFGGSFAVLRRPALLFMTVSFATFSLWSALAIVEVDDELIALILGAWLIAASVAVDRTGYASLTAGWYFLGAAAFLYGFFDVVDGTALEITFLAVAAGFVYLSAVVHSRTLLAVATLAILSYTAWFTGQHFADSIGWPLALIAFGIFMIGLSALAFRIDRDYVRVRT